jgi:hypothetical protein
MSDAEAELAGAEGEIVLCTQRERDGEVAGGSLGLAPWQGAVLRTGS